MLFKLLLSYSLIAISTNYAEIINATETVGNTVYYIANTTRAFEEGYIICDENTPICHVECNGEYACYETTINATFAEELFLECNDRYACSSITVYGPTNSSDVQCNAYYSCDNTNFQFADTPSVHMYCSGISGQTSNACALFNLDVSRSKSVDIVCAEPQSCNSGHINATFITNSVDILCNASSSCGSNTLHALQANQVNVACNGDIRTSCSGLNVYCPSEHTNQCNIDCGTGTEKACNYFNIYTADNYTDGFMTVAIDSCPYANNPSVSCAQFAMRCLDSDSYTTYHYDPDSTLSYCSNYGCCPITDFQLDTQCNEGEDCIVNCTQNDPFDIDCFVATIDASKASSLTLYCETDAACNIASVLCPIGGDCNIICEGSSACASLILHASLSSNTNLTCGAGTYSCKSLNLYAENNTNVNVLCSIGGDCGGARFRVSNSENVDIICDGDCADYIYAYNTTKTDITCAESGACSGLWVEGKGSDAVTVNCEASSSCRVRLFCPEHGSCTLNCIDTQSTTGSCTNSWMLFDGTDLTDYNSSNMFNLSCSSNEYDCADIIFDCEHYDRVSGGLPYTEYEWNPFAQRYVCSDSVCCPKWIEIVCEAGQDCHIECNDTGSVICSNARINAKDASSLTVDCIHGQCQGTIFECPSASNTSCNINCDSSSLFQPCWYAEFYGNGATDINIECTGSGPGVCRDMIIDIRSDQNVVNFNNSQAGCDDLDFINYGLDSVSNIFCDHCYSASFKFNSSKTISVECNDEYGCNSASFDGGFGGEVNFECNAFKACHGARLECSHADSLTFAANVNYSISESGSSSYDGLYLTPPVNVESGTDITCSAEKACHNLRIGSSGFVDHWLDMQCTSDTRVCSNVTVGCYISDPNGVYETTLSSDTNSTSEYICDSASSSLLCCPFGVTELGTTQETQETQSPQETQRTQDNTADTHVAETTEMYSTTGGPAGGNDDNASNFSILYSILLSFIFLF
eukprot:214341_1